MSRHLDKINEQILNELGHLKTQRFEAETFVIEFSGPHVEHHMPTGEEWSVWPNDTLAAPLQMKF